jgi:hypothetical protein
MAQEADLGELRRLAPVELRDGRLDCVRGWVKEITVVSADSEPLEPDAEVLLLKREEPKPPRSGPARRRHAEPGGEVIHGGPKIIRHGIGRVLGVRCLENGDRR